MVFGPAGSYFPLRLNEHIAIFR